MAYAHVGTVVGTGLGFTQHTNTPAWGSNQNRTAGHLLVCFAHVNTNNWASISISAGWTLINSLAYQTLDTWGYVHGTIIGWYRVATGGDAAPTVTSSDNTLYVGSILDEFSGNDTSSPLDNIGASTPVNHTSSPVTATMSTGTTKDVAPGELLLYFGAETNSASAQNNPVVYSINNGATAHTTVNPGANVVNFMYGYGITTSNANADSVSMSHGTTNFDTNGLIIGSFKLPGTTHVVAAGTVTETESAKVVTPVKTRTPKFIAVGRVTEAESATVITGYVSGAPISSGDLDYYYSGGVLNSNHDMSLGGDISATKILGGSSNNTFDSTTAAEDTSGVTSYECIYFKNNHPSKTLTGAVVWIDGTPAQGTLAIGLDSAAIGASAVSSSVDHHTAPSPTITFTSPTTKAAGLTIGDIPPGQYKAIWERRTINAGTSTGSDNVSIKVEGNTT